MIIQNQQLMFSQSISPLIGRNAGLVHPNHFNSVHFNPEVVKVPHNKEVP